MRSPGAGRLAVGHCVFHDPQWHALRPGRTGITRLWLGRRSTTASIESAAGVPAGGRTGLTALTVAVLFLACLFIAPLGGVVPAYATAPALLYVSCLMLRGLVDLDWTDTTESVPAVLTALMMPFTDSIANGVAFGFIIDSDLKLFGGRWREVPTIVWIISLIFLFRFFYLPA